MVTLSQSSLDRAELARARAGLYGLLARVFGNRPAPELVRGMRAPAMRGALAALGIGFNPGFLGSGADLVAEELLSEYTRLFVGPGPHIPINESLYVTAGDPEPRLWGTATVAVAAFFGELGFEVPEGAVPDHVSLELEAMAAMAGAEADRLGAGDEAAADRFRQLRQRFCREHLKRWLPLFCRAVIRNDGSGFYGGMAELAGALADEAFGAADSFSDGDERPSAKLDERSLATHGEGAER